MDPPSSPQQPPQPPQPQPQPAGQSAAGGSRNKNLSIKEFFTTRLMRTRSFEAGAANNNNGQHSPKDEPLNWFEEFKSRMTKKSQNSQNSNKQHTAGGQQTVKDNCDTSFLANLAEDCEEESEEAPSSSLTNLQSTLKDTSTTSKSHVSGLRKRNIQVISSSVVESPDFDTASIDTIFNNRHDIRHYDRKPFRELIQTKFSKFLNLLTWIVSHSIPFNYNLPWKLLSLINFSFVLIVIGLITQTRPDVRTFSFFNGFIFGILIASVTFMILVTSFIVTLLPKTSNETTTKTPQTTPKLNNHSPKLDTQDLSRNSSSKLNETSNSADSKNDSQKQDEYSTFEVLESKTYNNDVIDQSMPENQLVDHDYKGWMIEFVGDYEQRSKPELFKLKLIYVKIENKILYLCKPKNSNDVESTTFPAFVQQRTYNLGTATKFSACLLLPKNVHNTQKWVWSKKYPIKLEFQDETATIQPPPKSPETNWSKNVQLTLFAKCGREKEEWFRRFKRIVEENRLAQVVHKRFSFQSDISGPSEEGYGIFGSVKSFRCRSPSPTSKSATIQSSKSSNVLNDSRKFQTEASKILDNNNGPNNLTRTKSCELINDQAETGGQLDPQEQSEFSEKDLDECEIADESTLTRETAEVFSQAVEFSNFLDNQPTLNYKEYIERVIESGQEATPTADWFNALTGRILFDVLSREYWSVWFKRKIQRKLYRIRLPYFMETLTLTNIDLGTNAPQFLNVVSHSFDSFGLSIDFDMTYSGGLSMTFETKLNLLKFKNDHSTTGPESSSGMPTTTQSSSNNNNDNDNNNNNTNSNTNPSFSSASSSSTPLNNDCSPNNVSNQQNQPSSQIISDNITKENNTISSENKTNNIESANTKERNKIQQSALNQSSSGSARTSEESSDSCDSDSSSSSDSSCDEADVDEISDWEDYGAERTRQNIVRFVDKIASSRYFQHATENRYIKKKLIDISNCPLVLIVEIQSLSGVLTVNVPPPQTDRIWYGFRPNPELTLKASPRLGDRKVNLSHVTDWIEKKLAEEFRKILVIPNMEDIVLPVLKSDHLSYVTTTR